jgi:hypothetical protein
MAELEELIWLDAGSTRFSDYLPVKTTDPFESSVIHASGNRPEMVLRIREDITKHYPGKGYNSFAIWWSIPMEFYGKMPANLELVRTFYRGFKSELLPKRASNTYQEFEA